MADQKKQSLAEFGRTIKTKHPEYNDLPDEDLGRRVLGKYPQYSDMVDTAATPPAPPVEKPGALSRFASSAADSSGLSAIGHALAHPIDTVGNVVQALNPGTSTEDFDKNPIVAGVRGAVDNTVQNAKKGWADYHREGLTPQTRRDFGRAVPIVGPALAQAQAQHDAGDDAGMAGTVTGTVASLLAPKIMKEVSPTATDAMTSAAARAPEAADNAAAGIINKTVGSRKADFARGANPGRGYIKTNLGSSASMESIADKAQVAREDVGSQLQNAYTKATTSGKKIPAADVRKAVDGVIDDARNSAAGPGVMADPEAYENLRETFDADIADAHKNGGFTPQELWDIRKNINRNLNWGDQSKLNMTKTQQSVSGALGGLLKDAVPETVDLNQQYQDLTNLSDRAEVRALTHQSPLTSIGGKIMTSAAGAVAGHSLPGGPLTGAALGAAADSIPAKTTLANWLSKSGRAVPAVAKEAGEMLPATGAIPPSLSAVSGNDQVGPVGNADNKENEQSAPNSLDQVGSPMPSIPPQPTIQDKTIVPANADKGIQPVMLPVEAPASSDISAAPSPDTHHFSKEAWLSQNLGGDIDAAANLAEQAGYEVV